MLRIREVARELNVSERTVLRLIKSGKINAVRVGNQWRISQEEVKRLKGE